MVSPLLSFSKKTRYQLNTVELDTWLTLGQTTKGSRKYLLRTLKNRRQKWLFIGGYPNNDGGSYL